MFLRAQVDRLFLMFAASVFEESDRVCFPVGETNSMQRFARLAWMLLDCGRSMLAHPRGGFTDCLLQHGAKSVACVDVNYSQLAWSIRQDERVAVFERTNIKQADPVELGAPFDIIVIDVSFISLASLADVLARLARQETILIALVKPQFESRHEETVSGVVVDEEVRQRTLEEVCIALRKSGFAVVDSMTSPVRGPAGNVEYLVLARYLDRC